MASPKSRFVAEITPTSIFLNLLPPTLTTILSCRKRSRLTCISIGISPISSRRIVPSSASSNFPIAPPFLAPENAPSSYPNNSLCNNSLGIAPQFTGIKAPFRLRPLCMARAKTSLPVPVSPMIRTLEFTRQALMANSFTRCQAGLRPPTISSIIGGL